MLSLDKDHSGPLETAGKSLLGTWIPVRQARGKSPLLCERRHCQTYRHSSLHRSAHCDHKKQLANGWNLQGAVFQVTIRRIGRKPALPSISPPALSEALLQLFFSSTNRTTALVNLFTFLRASLKMTAHRIRVWFEIALLTLFLPAAFTRCTCSIIQCLTYLFTSVPPPTYDALFGTQKGDIGPENA